LLRGINKQNIFEDDDDRLAFLHILANTIRTSSLELFCYCIMDNHIHLLLGEGGEPLGQNIKRLAVPYAMRFNNKYERTGHLFQDRFRSEVIATESHLLAAVRYICQNPVKAGLCKRPKDYRWSSCREYLGIEPGITKTESILGMFSIDSTDQVRGFAEFVQVPSDDSFIDSDDGRRNDFELREALRRLAGTDNATAFQSLEVLRRDECLHQLREEGFSVRQISRVTGVSVGVIRYR